MGTISEQIKTIEFLIDMVKYGIVYFGSGKLEITSTKIINEDFVKNLKNNLQVLKDIQTLLNYFNVDPNILNTKLLDKRDTVNLGFLVDIFVYNKPFETIPFLPGFNAVKIGNITLGIFIYKKVEEKYFTVIDLFKQMDKVVFHANIEDGEYFTVSLYVFLKQDFITLVDNSNLNNVVDDIKRISFTKEYGRLVNLLGLELIKAYDISARNEFLRAAFDIFIWLQEMEKEDPVNRINELQILRRQRTYYKDERNILMQMRTDSYNNNRMLCGINILLENKSDAETYFDQLAEEDKTEFIRYPIFTLAKQFGMFENI